MHQANPGANTGNSLAPVTIVEPLVMVKVAWKDFMVGADFGKLKGLNAAPMVTSSTKVPGYGPLAVPSAW